MTDNTELLGGLSKSQIADQIESDEYEDSLWDDDDDEGTYDDCPKCGRTYDEIGRELQYCKACGWDAENEKWEKSIEPTDADFMAGEADILTGRWF